MRPDRAQLATVPLIEAPEPSLVNHDPVNPDKPEIQEPGIRNVIPGGPADHLAKAIPVVAPLKPVVRWEAAEYRATARTPEQVARSLAAVSAENPRLSPVTGRPLAPRCSNWKCGNSSHIKITQPFDMVPRFNLPFISEALAAMLKLTEKSPPALTLPH